MSFFSVSLLGLLVSDFQVGVDIGAAITRPEINSGIQEVLSKKSPPEN